MTVKWRSEWEGRSMCAGLVGVPSEGVEEGGGRGGWNT